MRVGCDLCSHPMDDSDNRVSSSKRTMMRDHDGSVPSSSIREVVFNDDLLIEILLQLPVISRFFFKSVSKRWLSLITSPAFFNLRLTRFPYIHPPSGLFLQQINSEHNHFQHDFISLDSRIPAGKKKSSAFTFGCFGMDASNVEVLQSCNGLVLCVIRNDPGKICVYNPSINMFKMLPQVHGLKISRFMDNMRLGFDPAKSPHYKVLHIREIPKESSILTWIYFSERGCWIIGNSLPLQWYCGLFHRGVYWDDAIHWLDFKNQVRHFKLDVEHPHDTTTEPPKTLDRYSYKELFESCGCLLFACAGDPLNKHLNIYEMGNGYSGWSLKYIVKYEDSISTFFETWKKSTVKFRFDVLSIVLGEREDESFIVMKPCGKVVKYNLLLKTLHILCNMDTHLTKFHTFPFIASFAGV
uniref:F-box protein At5g07610-like n=1 Tax=Erigeron canadensis TaxID=72917 RepID=UPI001CB8DF2A|nr:F-box protein At5g07610-like [Erigeron canadensis]